MNKRQQKMVYFEMRAQVGTRQKIIFRKCILIRRFVDEDYFPIGV